MKTRTSNENLKAVIQLLERAGKRSRAALWRALAQELGSSRSRRAEVNLSRLQRYGEGEIIAVPGKVLGSGSIESAMTVAALSFSKAAREKIIKAGGRCISFEELLKENPKGSKVRIMRGA